KDGSMSDRSRFRNFAPNDGLTRFDINQNRDVIFVHWTRRQYARIDPILQSLLDFADLLIRIHLGYLLLRTSPAPEDPNFLLKRETGYPILLRQGLPLVLGHRDCAPLATRSLPASATAACLAVVH